VARLRSRFGVSERRACRVIGAHRSTHRLPRPARPDEQTRLRAELRRIARKHPRWGWRMAYRLLRRDATKPWQGVNHKRVQRLWREEGLRRPVRTRKRRRRDGGNAELLRAERPNQVWALDFQFDETADRRRLKSLHVVDEHTREALAMRVGRTCTADQVVDVLADLVAVRGAPEHLRMDNGPEMIAWALRDHCRLTGTRTTYIEPGSPWENPFIESFNSRARDELFNTEEFATLLEAQVIVEAWRTEYNTYRPHSSLGDKTPAEYAASWTSQTQPALS
jgi:putative transposase